MEAIDAIERSTHLIAVALEPRLSELGVGQAEAHVLAQLASRPAMTLGELHREFGHKRSTLTSLIDRLERRGFLTRTTNPEDRRSVRVELTAAGGEPARRLLAAREELGRALGHELGAEGLTALAAAARTLERLAAERSPDR